MLRFVGDGDQKIFTKNPRHFSMQNSQAKTKKIFTKFFWRADKVRESSGFEIGVGPRLLKSSSLLLRNL